MASAEAQRPNSEPSTPPTNVRNTPTLDEEIDKLTTEFKGQCKVIESSGRFRKIVKLHPKERNIVFNFKIPDCYPDRQAVVEIRSENLDEDDCFDLTGYLTQVLDKNPSESFDSIVEIGLGWLKEGKIDIKSTRKKAKPQRKHKGKSKKNKTEQVDKPKKPPMKTAIDVVKRIMWDDDVDRDHCIVGYIDRLEGLKEKYFNAFSWEDIASVDYTVLAIPKHRIQYFKYRGEIVWDKRVRLDNFFGSTGSKTTIKDVIRRQDGGNGGGNVANYYYVDNAGDNYNGWNDEPAVQKEDSDYYDSGDITDSDSDSDSDDGITVTIGQGAAQGFYGADYDDEDCDRVPGENGKYDEEKEFDKFWTDKLRPNYFVALRITDEEIRKTVQDIQTHITNYEPCFKPCNMPATSLHITLCTLGLDTPEQVQNASQCLQNIKHELKSFVPKHKQLKFVGLDNFFNRVVYGKVADCPTEFYELVEHLKLCLISQGVEIRDNHEFVPHMTLMKISRPVARATGKKYVSPWLYSCFNDTEIGNQAIDNIHLCEMGDSRQGDGFYLTALSMDL